MNQENVKIVLCTFPSVEKARQIGTLLVETQLAACVNIIANITSIYKWKGNTEHQDEFLMIFKTSRNCLPQLMEKIKELHPYELPEIIAFPIEYAHPPYLDWVTSIN